jgi:hypothetical protein
VTFVSTCAQTMREAPQDGKFDWTTLAFRASDTIATARTLDGPATRGLSADDVSPLKLHRPYSSYAQRCPTSAQAEGKFLFLFRITFRVGHQNLAVGP